MVVSIPQLDVYYIDFAEEKEKNAALQKRRESEKDF